MSSFTDPGVELSVLLKEHLPPSVCGTHDVMWCEKLQSYYLYVDGVKSIALGDWHSVRRVIKGYRAAIDGISDCPYKMLGSVDARNWRAGYVLYTGR